MFCSQGSGGPHKWLQVAWLQVMVWCSEPALPMLLPLHHVARPTGALVAPEWRSFSPRRLKGRGWGPTTFSLAATSGLSPHTLPMGRRGWARRGQEGRCLYLQLCRGRSRSPAVGWPHLCNSPLRSPGWQGRRDRRQVLGCWPPGSLRAAPGWSLPGKRARQNSVEHCSYSGLVCRE